MKILIKKNISKHDINNSSKIFNKKKVNLYLEKKNWDYPNSKQFIIYLKKNNTYVGMLRVIKKKIFLFKKFYNVACLASIGIFPNFRKLGYGKILMKKSNSYIKKNFDIAFLIARRKADFFYCKFNFIGNSEFFSIIINFKNKENNNLSKFKINSHKKKKISNNLKKFYINSNKTKSGYFNREKKDWRMIDFRINQNKFLINEFKYKKNSIGYIVYKKNCIYEYGYNINFLRLFIYAIKGAFKKKVEIRNPDNRMIREFKKYDEVMLNKRFCTYGGHMINIFRKKELENIHYNINYFDEF